MKLEEELLNEAKNCKSEEELIELASKNNINLTNEEAHSIYSTLSKSGELSDNELENTNGGSPCGDLYNSGSTPKYKVDDILTYEGNKVRVVQVLNNETYGNSWTSYYGNAFSYIVEIIVCNTCCYDMHQRVTVSEPCLG